MTGFARTSGSHAAWRWSVELKSVNARGLDLRLRVPAGFDRIESEARTRLAKTLARGSVFATLTAMREGVAPQVRIDQAALAAIMSAVGDTAKTFGLAPPTMDGLLAIRGIVDIVEAPDDEPTMTAACAGMLASLDAAVAALADMRSSEGAALGAVLDDKLASIEALVKAADASPARKPEAVRARLAQSAAALMDSARGFDENRLHQEAVLLAAKADIREELDRLYAHVGAIRDLLGQGGPVGRKLDFLAQELGREANTLCAKANDIALTNIGLDLRAQIEQLREQVQNIE